MAPIDVNSFDWFLDDVWLTLSHEKKEFSRICRWCLSTQKWINQSIRKRHSSIVVIRNSRQSSEKNDFILSALVRVNWRGIKTRIEVAKYAVSIAWLICGFRRILTFGSIQKQNTNKRWMPNDQIESLLIYSLASVRTHCILEPIIIQCV